MPSSKANDSTITLHQSYLWWMGVTALLKAPKESPVRVRILHQVGQRVSVSDSGDPLDKIGVNLDIPMWRATFEGWESSPHRLYQRAGEVLHRVYDEAWAEPWNRGRKVMR
jgi:hypothetical protein